MKTKQREKLRKESVGVVDANKSKNSMDDQTIDNIERIVFQINEQILITSRY